MKIGVKLSLSIALFSTYLFFPVQVWAVTCEAVPPATCYYVATNGSASNPGTAAAPFATYAQANAVLAAGDYLYYRAGVYTNTNTFIQYDKKINGASGQRITIKAYPRESVAFDNGGRGGSLAYLGGAGAVVEGFEFRNSVQLAPTKNGIDGWTPGIAIWGSYITFRKNWVHDITGDASGNGGSLRIQGGDHNEIYNNAFERLFMPLPPNGSRWNVQHIIMFNGGFQKIHSNYFSHSENEGQGCVLQKHPARAGWTSEVYNNTFENCSDAGFTLAGADYYVHHNLFINSQMNFDYGGGDATFEYNTIVSNKQMLIEGNGAAISRRNLLYQTATNYGTGDGFYTMRINHYVKDSSIRSKDSFSNNCYYNPNRAVMFSYFGATIGGVYTLAQFNAVEGEDSGSVEADPKFVNAAANDYRTQPGSPCAEMGVYAVSNPGNPPLTPAAAIAGTFIPPSPPPNPVTPTTPVAPTGATLR
jgi:hypothetical protein